MRLAIRDDDTSYFTRPEELERIYSRFAGLPVSLAVTPFALKSEHLGDPLRFRQTGPPRPLRENRELVQYLREGVAREQFSILCHGYTHEYKRELGQLIQECVWKTPEKLLDETPVGKRHLEELFEGPVETYVPPGNAISRGGIAAIGRHFPYMLATLPLRRYREFVFDREARPAWWNRLIDQVKLSGPSPAPYRIGTTQLLACCSWTSVSDWNTTCARMELCHRLGADFTIAVHYWELQGAILDGLHRLVGKAIGLGFEPAHCNKLFEKTVVRPETVAASAVRKDSAWADSKIS